VTSFAALKATVSGTAKTIVRINGMLSGCGIMDVGSNTSIFGQGSNSGFTGSGFRVKQGTNVIFRNLKMGPAPTSGDILAFDRSTKSGLITAISSLWGWLVGRMIMTLNLSL
jgi:pectate lyase